MGFFSKLLGGSSVAPEWASFFEQGEYAVFERHLRQALAARALPNAARDVRAGSIPLKARGEDASLGFGPIARKCRGNAQESWPGVIADHLDRALESRDERSAHLGADFEAARACLKVQLVPDYFMRPTWEEWLNFRTFGPGIKAALVYDLPTSVDTVPVEHVRGWDRASADLFDIAAENVRKEAEQPTVEHVELAEERVVLEQLVGDSFFICSHALWLESYREASSDRGALVTIPSRHTVLFHAIRDASAWRALTSLPFMAIDLHSKLPGPVSSNIFWVKDGAVTMVPVHRSGDQLQVMPPQPVLDALAGLKE